MSGLKCEFPEGCRLDLWAKVIKAKFIERQCRVLDTTFCVPDSGPNGVGGKIDMIDDIKVKVIESFEDLNFNKVKIYVKYEVILFAIVDGCYQIVTVNDTFEQTIELSEFDPPLSAEEFRNEIEDSEIIICNWNFDYEIRGFCEDPCSPCMPLPGPVPPGPLPPGPGPVPMPGPCPTGTCLQLVVYADIICKLGKMHDIIVYGELDPEIDC